MYKFYSIFPLIILPLSPSLFSFSSFILLFNKSVYFFYNLPHIQIVYLLFATHDKYGSVTVSLLERALDSEVYKCPSGSTHFLFLNLRYV